MAQSHGYVLERSIFLLINVCVAWSDRLSLSEDACNELQFWQQNIVALNGRSIWFSPSITRVAYSDASGSGCGGFIVEHGPEISHGQWSPDQAKCSSTWRELRAVDHVLRSFAPKLQGHTVKWFTNNQNVARIVESGSKKPYLQDGAISIHVVPSLGCQWAACCNVQVQRCRKRKLFSAVRIASVDLPVTDGQTHGQL